jgi:hypothetical protein
MGSRSQKKPYKPFRSTKNLKQWCRARGIDFKVHCETNKLKLSK